MMVTYRWYCNDEACNQALARKPYYTRESAAKDGRAHQQATGHTVSIVKFGRGHTLRRFRY
jgi:hypothetical protein